ncbi:acetyl-coenzyme A synthetase, cytoplasmic [Platysternon megacephalum]|uniref:Acetyl-coenzyme A synthetase, cytoplasmic n=1 Tax=Platysternon megacephalum TaxID=55544 RepID=A0A4D9EEG4_9SAUR|nr:acetyl-coenzyme A synthetase, cytoplasmic [Platysternon megacephalum]
MCKQLARAHSGDHRSKLRLRKGRRSVRSQRQARQRVGLGFSLLAIFFIRVDNTALLPVTQVV